jgi:cysteine desulfurase
MWNNLKNKLGFITHTKRQVYLDTASATKTDKSVILAMYEAESLFANPSSLHRLGVLARNEVENSRGIVAKFINAHADEIVFTSSGTEGDNLAILGAIKSAQINGIIKPHIIISEIEHSAVIGLVQKLESKNEISASYLPVDENGVVDLKVLPELINENTILISVHLVNNEVGTLEPIKEIVKIARNYKKHKNINDAVSVYPLVHTDACQATAYIEINVNQLGVDMLSFNGQKMYGPKGVGVLFVKRGTPIEPVFIGGEQEFCIRPGTESLPLIAGLARACNIASIRQEGDFEILTDLRNYFITEIEKIPNTFVYAKNVLVSPHIINVEFKNISSETLLLYLDSRGIYASNKSACKSGGEGESHVLKAIKHAKIGIQEGVLDDFGSIRFSLGRNTTKKDLDYVIRNLKEVLNILKI